MIGWTHGASRDYAEAVMNGGFDDDLDRMIETLKERKLAKVWPRCPDCGELLIERHDHGAYVVIPRDPG